MALLNSRGNANPPGVQVPYGAVPPAYQAAPGAPWNGAARGVANAPNVRPITKHFGMPSNDVIKSQHTVFSWEGGEHKLIRPGQITFVAREIPKGGEDSLARNAKLVTLAHLNKICRVGFIRARRALEAGQLPDGIKLSAADFDALGEHNIEEFMGSKEREDLIPEDNMKMKAAVKLLKIGAFKYLLPCSVRMYWNLYGVVTNTAQAMSPEIRVQRDGVAIVVVQTVAKKAFASNIWGGKSKIAEGCRLGLIIRRTNGHSSPNVRQPEYIPWSHVEEDTPALSERGYFDEKNVFQVGHYLPLGTCAEVEGPDPAERKRLQAIGNQELADVTVHDAMGSLPQIAITIGCY